MKHKNIRSKRHSANFLNNDGNPVILALLILVLFIGLVFAARECSDGVDNDGDGLIDLSDPNCANPNDKDETGCGDGVCEGGESRETCSLDCSSKSAPAKCGDNTCSGTETSFDCPQDCGAPVEWSS